MDSILHVAVWLAVDVRLRCLELHRVGGGARQETEKMNQGVTQVGKVYITKFQITLPET